MSATLYYSSVNLAKSEQTLLDSIDLSALNEDDDIRYNNFKELDVLTEENEANYDLD